MKNYVLLFLILLFAPSCLQLSNENPVEFEIHDYFDGLTQSNHQNRPILLYFSGIGSLNSRLIEGNILSMSLVKKKLSDGFILVELVCDDTRDLENPIQVVENGDTLTLHTVGQKNCWIQREYFMVQEQPYFVIIDKNGKPLTEPMGYVEKPHLFLKFLKEGLNNYRTFNR